MLVAALLLVLGCAPERAEVAPPPPPPPPAAPVRDGQLHVGAVELVREVDGLRLERQPWRLDDEVGVAWRIRLPRTARLEVAPSDAVAPFATLLPTDAGPWVAVNGGFYDDKGRPMGLVVADGRIVHKLGRSGSGVLEHGEGGVRIVHRDDWKPGTRSAVQSIDRLVEDGRPLVEPKAAARRAARSGVAVTDDAVWVVVAFADDSVVATSEGVSLHATSLRGLPLWAFARYLADEVDADAALNLDGAVSTQLALRSGDFRWSVQGEDGTVQAVVLRP